ncbi:MAG: Spy/CpxP family protein refolding chaperone [bacterium]
MLKTTFLWVVAAFFMSATFLVANPATAQEGMMEGKHEMGMMHRGMKGEQHQEGMHCCRMMEGEHHEGHEFFLGMKDELELSDEQVAKLRNLKSETQKQAIRTKADLEIVRIELHDLLSQDKVDVKAVDARIEKMGELQTKMHKAHIHARLDAQEILTPEQLKKYKEIKGKGRHGMHMREKDM